MNYSRCASEIVHFKRRSLMELIKEDVPLDSERHEEHEKSVLRAKQYIAELDKMKELKLINTTSYVVPKHVYDSAIKQSDNCVILFEGKHCQAVRMIVSGQEVILLHLPPVRP